MFSGMVAFEWRYHTHRLSFLASVLLMAFVPLATVTTGFGPASAAVNAPYIVMETAGIVTLVSVFALPMLCVGATVRDSEFRMQELIGSSPVSRGVLLGGRFVGVFAAALAIMAIALVVQAVSPFLVSLPDERVVSFRPTSYLSAFAMLTVPTTLFCAALLYLIAAASRSTLATFVASIAIYAGYAVTAMMVDSPLMAGTRPPTAELLARAALLDPFGLSAFFEQTRYWTPLERNTRLVTLSGNLFWNRLLVLGLTALCLLPLPWLERRRSRPARVRRTTAETHALAPSDHVVAARVVPVVPNARPIATLASATRAVAGLELSLLLRSWPLRALLVLWVSVIAIEADGQLAGGEYGTRMLASSAVLADAVPIGLWLIGTLCALYFSADVIWRERLLRFDGIRDATPVANLSLLLGKLGALSLIPVLLTVAGYGTAMVVHATAGGLPIEPSVYAWHAVTSLVPLWTTTIVAVALQLFVGNRWVGLLLGFAVAFVNGNGELIGLEHPLLRFGTAPPLRWSDLSGFGNALPSWIAFNVTWAMGGLVLIGVAAACWPRGLDEPFRARLRTLPRRVARGTSRASRITLAVVIVAFIGTYAWMVRETIYVAQWESERDGLAWRADYERRYRRLERLPQPQIIDVALSVDLHPAQRRAEIHGTLTVENRTDLAIDTLWIMPARHVRDGRVMATGASSAVYDARFGVYIVPLAASLTPGARTTIAYGFSLDRSGIRGDGFADDVAKNGSFITSQAIVPTMGYQGRYEIADEAERATRGLGTASAMLGTATQLDSLAADARAHGLSPAWYTVRTTISTSADQTAHGAGVLTKAWMVGDRRYFEYRLDQPSTPYFAITSARYVVARRRYREVPVELWYHAGHGVQAARLVDIAVRSLETFETQFGPYPHPLLRLIEVPASLGFGAYAQTGAIYLTESRGMLSDARDGDVDLMLRRIGHEVAHQWWGHTVDPIWAEGRLTIVETLAKYSEQLLLGAAQGDAVLATMMSFDHDRYLTGRANTIGLEQTLVATTDESHLYYGKGALAFHALRDVLGDSAINAALRTLLQRESGPRGAASATALYEMLSAAARDDDARAAVHEWFTERVIYDLSADSAFAHAQDAAPRATYRVTARFRVQRVRTDSAGEHVESADGALVTVGVYGGTTQTPQLLVRRRLRASGGVVDLEATVVGAPIFVEIDPEIRLIDRDRSNNRATLNLERFNRKSVLALRPRAP